MDEQNIVDIKPYIQKIAHKWYWIVGTAILFSVAVFIGFTISSPKYQAVALVTITNQQTDVLTSLTDQSLSPQLVTIYTPDELVRVYPKLAMSDELLGNLNNSLSDHQANRVYSLSSLRKISSVELDNNLLTFEIIHEDPEFAAEAVNSWASLFVNWTNELYTSQNITDLEFYTGQIDETLNQLRIIEEQLIDFEANNRSLIIQNQIEALNDFQVSLLNEKQDLPFLITEANQLYSRLNNIEEKVTPDGSNELLILLLELRSIEEKANLPIQIQLSINQSNSDSSLQLTGQINLIEDIASNLLARQAIVEEQLVIVENQILTLQQNKQTIDIEFERLLRKRDTLSESLVALNRKLEEVQISSQDVRGGVYLASRATIPDKPISSQKAAYAIVAGILGMAFATGFLFLKEWWALYLQ